jgi:hypothetical protein
MTKTLTPEQLVLFVYDEISDPQDREEISNMVKADNASYDMFTELAGVREKIEQDFASPSENSIQRILNYSRALRVVHTKDHHTLGLVLN